MRKSTLQSAELRSYAEDAEQHGNHWVPLHPAALRELADELDMLRRALHEIAEEWAGAECGEPVHAQEAYAIALAKRMYALAAAALRTNATLSR